MDGRGMAGAEPGPESGADWKEWTALCFAPARPVPPPDPWLGRWTALSVLVLHAGLAWLLVELSAPQAPLRVRDEAILVEFLTRAPPPVVPPPVAAPPPRTTEPIPDRRPPASRSEPRRAPPAVSPAAPATVAPVVPKGTMQVFEIDGRLRVPDDLLEQVDAQTGNGRDFAYQMPGLDSGKALFERRVALEYKATRFDEYWQPSQTLTEELLTKAMEKTTKEIRIPVPGNPSATLVCKVSMLALGFGCMFEDHNLEYRVELDDPETLDPEEAKQCAVWWDRIVSATSQEVWRRTRDLYEAECRKPLLKAPVPAEG